MESCESYNCSVDFSDYESIGLARCESLQPLRHRVSGSWIPKLLDKRREPRGIRRTSVSDR
ncbi:MAG: hypothetical protein M3322_09775 [Actinomycetota bacterium]|nr:hypothetical protein [Actinomycetota bacterium]